MHVINQYADTIKPLAEMGTRMIGKVKDLIVAEFKASLFIEAEKPSCLLVSYVGYRMVFRVEIVFKRDGDPPREKLAAKLAAYSLSYDKEPKESLLVAYEFDRLGNVHLIRRELDSFAGLFLLDVFNAAAQHGMTLRPS